MARRQPIEELLEQPEISPDLKSKLRLVTEARNFAQSIGLTPGGAFRKYASMDRDVLAWVVSASARDKFELYTWWFPFVGRVPYKGYFDEEDAHAQAARLQSIGLETWVRGTEAISTLGWFDDPILSTTLQHDEASIANTVLHESLHSTIWIPNRVDFNESAAQFVGDEATVEFFKQRLAACGTDDKACLAKEDAFLAHAKKLRDWDKTLSATLVQLHQELEVLYTSNAAPEAKLAQRSEMFARITGPLRTANPQMKILREINNAEILQLWLYFGALRDFQPVFESVGRNWPTLLERFRLAQARALKDRQAPVSKLLAQNAP